MACHRPPSRVILANVMTQRRRRRAEDGPGQPPPAVTAGHGGGSQDAELDRLQRQYPQWRIWRGQATGDYWAMPPRGHPTVRDLIWASDIGELAGRLGQAEGRHGR
jgi:hypothetical protein